MMRGLLGLRGAARMRAPLSSLRLTRRLASTPREPKDEVVDNDRSDDEQDPQFDLAATMAALTPKEKEELFAAPRRRVRELKKQGRFVPYPRYRSGDPMPPEPDEEKEWANTVGSLVEQEDVVIHLFSPTDGTVTKHLSPVEVMELEEVLSSEGEQFVAAQREEQARAEEAMEEEEDEVMEEGDEEEMDQGLEETEQGLEETDDELGDIDEDTDTDDESKYEHLLADEKPVDLDSMDLNQLRDIAKEIEADVEDLELRLAQEPDLEQSDLKASDAKESEDAEDFDLEDLKALDVEHLEVDEEEGVEEGVALTGEEKEALADLRAELRKVDMEAELETDDPALRDLKATVQNRVGEVDDEEILDALNRIDGEDADEGLITLRVDSSFSPGEMARTEEGEEEQEVEEQEEEEEEEVPEVMDLEEQIMGDEEELTKEFEAEGITDDLATEPWLVPEFLPGDLSAIDRVTTLAARRDTIASDADLVRYVDDPDRMGGESMEQTVEKGSSPGETFARKFTGDPHPKEALQRYLDRMALGLPVSAEDSQSVEEMEAETETGMLLEAGLSSDDVQDIFDVSRVSYEAAKLAITELSGAKSTMLANSLPIHPSVMEQLTDELQVGPDGMQILPEELDVDAQIIQEQDPHAKKEHKCKICWCRGTAPPLEPVNVHLLRKFINSEGSILPRLQTGLCAKYQRKVATTIRRAKHMGLFSYKHGRFTIIDPFRETPTHEQIMAEIAKMSWERLYPKEAFPGLE